MRIDLWARILSLFKITAPIADEITFNNRRQAMAALDQAALRNLASGRCPPMRMDGHGIRIIRPGYHGRVTDLAK